MINLFNKPFAEVKTSDLVILSDIEEGWYFEFKQSASDLSKITKSVCAFANTYGGFLFIGVYEDSKTRKMESAKGMPLNDATNLVSQIATGIATHSSPQPYYEPRVFEGPLEAIGLETGQALVVLSVPESKTSPHIHSSGAIYKRVGDKAHPVRETDKYAVDKLFAKTNKYMEDFEAYLGRAQATFDADQVQCILFVTPQKTNRQDSGNPIKFSQFAEIAQDTLNFTYDCAYPYQTGFVARLSSALGPLQVGIPEWQYDSDWDTHVVNVILPGFSIKGGEINRTNSGQPTYLNEFIQELGSRGFSDASILELSPLCFMLAQQLQMIGRLARLGTNTATVKISVIIKNAFGTIPFLDTQGYILQIQKYGVPVLNQKMQVSSPLRRPDQWTDFTFRPFDESEFSDEGKFNGEGYAALLMPLITFFRSIGVRPVSFLGEDTSDSALAQKFSELCIKWIEGNQGKLSFKSINRNM